MNEHIEINRRLWDGWTRIHERSAFYDIPSFRAGRSTLKRIELERVGDVAGRDLLHLQCHFGLDTLSWARLGARVTGVDFSPAAIELACSLATETGVPAEFVCADVCDLPDTLHARFDIVYTSYGVLPWLPDLGCWARSVAAALRPGGVLHLIEFHPVADMLDESGERLVLSYFPDDAATRFPVQGSYAQPDADFTHDSYQWAHPFSDVIRSIIDAGLVLRDFAEYPYSPHNCYPFLEETAPGEFRVKGRQVEVPMLYGISATA